MLKSTSSVELIISEEKWESFTTLNTEDELESVEGGLVPVIVYYIGAFCSGWGIGVSLR